MRSTTDMIADCLTHQTQWLMVFLQTCDKCGVGQHTLGRSQCATCAVKREVKMLERGDQPRPLVPAPGRRRSGVPAEITIESTEQGSNPFPMTATGIREAWQAWEANVSEVLDRWVVELAIYGTAVLFVPDIGAIQTWTLTGQEREQWGRSVTSAALRAVKVTESATIASTTSVTTTTSRGSRTKMKKEESQHE